MNELTDEDCAAFDGYIVKWQQILNLNDWRVERSSKRSKKNMAEIGMDPDARLANYLIGVSFGPATVVTPQVLEQTALHELLHVFLFDLKHSDGDKTGIEHRVINVLEKLLMDKA